MRAYSKLQRFTGRITCALEVHKYNTDGEGVKVVITIIFVSNKCGKARSVSISLFTMYFVLFALAGLISVFTFCMVNYQRKKMERTEALEALKRNRGLSSQISSAESRLSRLRDKLKLLRKREVELSYLTDIDIGVEDISLVRTGESVERDLASDPQGYTTIYDNPISKLYSDVMQIQKEIAQYKESFKRLENYYKKRIDILASTPSIRPVYGRIASGVGYRLDPFGGPQKDYHEGIDIPVPEGTPLRTTADGVVKFAGWMGNYGKLIVIGHKYGYETSYAHCSQIKAKLFQEVKRGEVIAYVGNTGRSTGPHLHYEVRLGGSVKDPELYLMDY